MRFTKGKNFKNKREEQKCLDMVKKDIINKKREKEKNRVEDFLEIVLPLIKENVENIREDVVGIQSALEMTSYYTKERSSKNYAKVQKSFIKVLCAIDEFLNVNTSKIQSYDALADKIVFPFIDIHSEVESFLFLNRRAFLNENIYGDTADDMCYICEELEKMAGDWLSVNFLTMTNDTRFSSTYQTPYYDAKELDLNGLKTDKNGNKILPKGYITYSVHKGIVLVNDENDYTLLDKEVVLIQKDELLYEQNMDNSTEFNR